MGNPHTTPTSDPPPPPNPFFEPRGARRAPQTRRSRQGEGPAAEETPGPRKAAGTELRAPRSPAEPLGPGRCYGAEPRGGRCREPRVNSGNGGGAAAEARGGRRRWGAAPEGHSLNLPLSAVVIIKELEFVRVTRAVCVPWVSVAGDAQSAGVKCEFRVSWKK